jgi:hypothetical protein
LPISAADRQHLLFAARHQPGALRGTLAQAGKGREHALHVPHAAADLAGGDGEVLAHGKRREDPPALEHDGDTLADHHLRREGADTVTEHADRATAHAHEAHDGAHAGRLTGAIAAQQGEQPALAQPERPARGSSNSNRRGSCTSTMASSNRRRSP